MEPSFLRYSSAIIAGGMTRHLYPTERARSSSSHSGFLSSVAFMYRRRSDAEILSGKGMGPMVRPHQAMSSSVITELASGLESSQSMLEDRCESLVLSARQHAIDSEFVVFIIKSRRDNETFNPVNPVNRLV